MNECIRLFRFGRGRARVWRRWWVVILGLPLSPRPAYALTVGFPAVVEEGVWSNPLAGQGEASMTQPVDVNSATLDELLEVPELDYALAQLILSRRPFTPAAWDVLVSELGLTPQTLGFLVVAKTSDVRVTEWEFRTGALFSDRVEEATTRAGSYAYTRGRARMALRGTHAAGVGLIVSRRPRTEAVYDVGLGGLSSPGPTPQLALENASMYAYYPQWNAVLGGYAIGFGEGLVFSQGASRHVDTWRTQDALREDMRGARVRMPDNLQGAAAQVRLDDAVDGVFFVSSRRHDLYQYDVRYGPDAWDAGRLGSCDRSGAVRGAFTCGDDGAWYSNDIGATPLQYQTIRDAYREDIGGAHLNFRHGAWRAGVTAHRSAVSFPPDWPSARLAPSAQALGGGNAAGVDILWEGDAWRVGGEVARAGGDGGIVIRALWSRDSRLSLEASARYFGADFRNAHSRAEAAPDQTEGYARRNEAGARLRAQWRIARWELAADSSGWFAPYRRDGYGEWHVTAPDLRTRVGGRASWRYAPYQFYVHAYLSRSPPVVDAPHVDDTERDLHWAYRAGAWGHWANRWRAGLEYRTLASNDINVHLIRHISVHLGYRDAQVWLDVARAPLPGDPRMQARLAWRVEWSERNRFDVQYGVFFGERDGRWRNVAALAWELDIY